MHTVNKTQNWLKKSFRTFFKVIVTTFKSGPENHVLQYVVLRRELGWPHQQCQCRRPKVCHSEEVGQDVHELRFRLHQDISWLSGECH